MRKQEQGVRAQYNNDQAVGQARGRLTKHLQEV